MLAKKVFNANGYSRVPVYWPIWVKTIKTGNGKVKDYTINFSLFRFLFNPNRSLVRNSLMTDLVLINYPLILMRERNSSRVLC